MRIEVGADQHGFRLKEVVKAHLEAMGHEVVDVGIHDETPVDYPDIASIVARDVASGKAERGVLCCGTGLGMAITANKVPGVRAASVTDPYSAERAMKSNDARILCMGGRVVGTELAKVLVDHWVNSEFGGGESTRKVAKIARLDEERAPKA
jgi:ribose 5-phosphate isomerase B